MSNSTTEQAGVEPGIAEGDPCVYQGDRPFRVLLPAHLSTVDATAKSLGLVAE